MTGPRPTSPRSAAGRPMGAPLPAAIPTKCYDLQDTAMILVQHLGRSMVWTYYLTDVIAFRFRAFPGLELLPVGKRLYWGRYRPMYAAADIVRFVRAVRAADPSRLPSPATPVVLGIRPGIPWSLQRFDADGNPVPHAAPKKPKKPKSSAAAATTPLH